jgi:hypothetical protein
MVEDKSIAERIVKIREYSKLGDWTSAHVETTDVYEIGMLGKSVLIDTVGDGHPLMEGFSTAMSGPNHNLMRASCRALVMIYDQGALRSPVLRVAQDLEGEILAVADAQTRLAEEAPDTSSKEMRLAVAAFLAGAALEDALRRLCDKNKVSYDSDRTSLDKLRSALYSPNRGIEFISSSDSKVITSWGDTRNKADHGHFDQLRPVEVGMMVVGVRDFVARALA